MILLPLPVPVPLPLSVPVPVRLTRPAAHKGLEERGEGTYQLLRPWVALLTWSDFTHAPIALRPSITGWPGCIPCACPPLPEVRLPLPWCRCGLAVGAVPP